MGKAAFINDDGKLVIDLAEADKLWNRLSEKQQFDAMSAMFEPLLARATEMRLALEETTRTAPDEKTAKLASEALRKTSA